MYNNVFRKSCRSRDNAKKQGRARQATDENIIGCKRTACWITKATNTPSEYVIPISFPSPPCYVIRTLPALYDLSKSYSADNGN